eukprot:3198694-Prorocentrum_lima.AAC.1
MGRPEEEKHNFYNQLRKMIGKHPQDKIIILGDFNAEVNWKEIEGLVQEAEEEETENQQTTNTNGERLQTL